MPADPLVLTLTLEKLSDLKVDLKAKDGADLDLSKVSIMLFYSPPATSSSPEPKVLDYAKGGPFNLNIESLSKSFGIKTETTSIHWGIPQSGELGLAISLDGATQSQLLKQLDKGVVTEADARLRLTNLILLITLCTHLYTAPDPVFGGVVIPENKP